MSTLEKILGKLPDARETASGWMARCPAHEDRKASLSIGEGADGRVLLRCHAGCDHKKIVSALGLEERDLFDAGSTRTTTKKKSSSSKPAFATADEAQKAYTRMFGDSATATFDYELDGKLVGRMLRWDQGNGKKEFRPISLHADGWRMEHMPTPRPLFGFSESLATGGRRVYVAEGEKCVIALRVRLKLPAFTSSGGAKAASKSDWSPLAGREVVILPDNDAPGREYAAEVAGILQELDPPAVVRIVELDGLEPGGDICDLTEWRDPKICQSLREMIERLADEAEPLQPRAALADRRDLIHAKKHIPAVSTVAAWRPFPTAALPEPLASLVREIAAAVDCDPAVAGVPMLPVLAAAIGTTARIELKVGYEQPAILWACVVAPVGSAKSAPFKYVVTPTRETDRILRQETAELRRGYAAELEVHEAGLAAWRKGRASGRAETTPPDRPEPPASRRAVVGDATVEALAEKLADNPRGLLLARDELSGWLGGLNRYRQGGSSSDEAFYLAAFEGESHSVDRRTGDRREIDVPVAALSVVGTIQPGILRSLITMERRQNGLLARLLLTAPPGRPAMWTEAEVSFATRQAFADVIAKLYGLQPETDFDGKETPRIVRIAPAAKKLFVEWINRTAEEIAETHAEDLAGALSKLRHIAARIALVIHETRVAIGEKIDRHAIDEDSMSKALTLAEWFNHETRRCYAILAESELDRADRQADDRLAEFVTRHGGAAAVRDVIAGCRWIMDADAGEKALQRLVDASLGRWIDKPPTEKGGRPSRLFVLDRETASAQPTKSPAQMSCADADILREVEIEPAGGYVDL